MTQTLIEQLEKFIEERLKGIDRTEIESPDGWWETSGGADFGESVLSDLRAIIDQHKREVPVCSHEPYHGKCVHCGIAFNGGVPSPQPDIVAELVKALEDDAYAASFQSMAGYRNALIAKVKGVIK